METEDLKETVAEVIADEAPKATPETPDLHERVKAATVAALRDGKISVDELRSIGRSLTEGISLGLSRRSGSVKESLSAAVSGLGQAYGEVSERMSLTFKESLERGKSFKDEDLKEPLERLKTLQDEFRTIVRDLTDKSGQHLKGEWHEVADHIGKVGSDIGVRMRESVESLYNRLHGETREAREAVRGALGESGSRVSDAASGLMAGVSEVLKRTDKDTPPPAA
ncbi:MAG TPA: DUF6781 family protein [Thiobacillaceae bacterium]|nr:DUF6781 family protein [Thiobacillaceae bacterium]